MPPTDRDPPCTGVTGPKAYQATQGIARLCQTREIQRLKESFEVRQCCVVAGENATSRDAPNLGQQSVLSLQSLSHRFAQPNATKAGSFASKPDVAPWGQSHLVLPLPLVQEPQPASFGRRNHHLLQEILSALLPVPWRQNSGLVGRDPRPPDGQMERAQEVSVVHALSQPSQPKSYHIQADAAPHTTGQASTSETMRLRTGYVFSVLQPREVL